MSAERVAPMSPWVGCVLSCDAGIARVLTDRGEVRASYAGSMLGRIARDRGCAAQPGDWVVLRRWCDDRVTIEDVWAPSTHCAEIISLHRD